MKASRWMPFAVLAALCATEAAAQKYLDLYERDKIPLPKNFKPLHPFNNGEQFVRDELLAGFPRTEDEVRKHLDDTWFGWIGASGKDDVFYYRIHSPVVLIEFDHQLPVALGGPRVPGKVHVHTVVRTPNGNDYGKDLLRQHYEKHANDPAHGHR